MSAVALPWYARPAAFIVLAAALVMSAPGEYSLAVLAGWSPWVAWLMPVCVSVYAAVAAMFVDSRPKGAPGRGTAVVGAAGALALALAAQVTAHLISAGFAASSAWLVAAVSAVPPVVVAHIMHMVARAHRVAVEEPVVAAADSAETVTGVSGQEPRNAEAIDGRELADTDADTEAEVVAAPSPPAELSVIDGGAGQADTIPGLEVVRTRRSGPRGRAVEEIREAVAALEADGQPVNGSTLASKLNVSDRTGRRYLEELAA
ncbi:helix-turn-helix domain-containing protein [Streptomyces halobius]|uniref:Helix-turn-helix domain-containing protein n=1 Tax=Streptomyces halobius TaxID=2879846 RepID=A0ABY4MEX5_9ACTN|nr:HTH domain-containing protein [Streptomyces halobius]UQA94960.1 helix-turn-helix domain-containing protein [Streptomyces halobius]